MSKALIAVALVAALCAAAIYQAGARVDPPAKKAAAPAPWTGPWSEEEEATETPALKAKEAATGVGLSPGEPYLGTKAELLAAAAKAPAPLKAAFMEQAKAKPPSPK